ncbi:MAG: HPr family phosphocarrier protein [Oscillospiraceae bacterium]|nr:HPr family phosphocarrier protein [Oscillospiraceae bacterium]
MVEIEHKIANENGGHVRPVGALVHEASKFKSEIVLNGINARKLMAIMSLGLKKNQEVKIIIDGPDEEKARMAIEKILVNHF